MDKPVYRMSSVGHCVRALSAERLNLSHKPAPDWLERAANEGKKHELWIKEELAAVNQEVFDDQLELKLEYPDFMLVGHIDGKIRVNGNVQLLEIKSMSEYEFNRWMRGKFEEFPSYAAQIACYMKGTSLLECMYLVKNRSSGYIDKAVINEPPASFDEIIATLEMIEETVTNGVLVDTEYLPESLQCKRCNYKEHCIPEPTEYKAIPEELLTEATVCWRKSKDLEAEAKTLADHSKPEFLKQTEASGQKKWRFNELTINKIDVRESVTYPKAELLKVFTEEQLRPASQIKLPYSFLRIDDLRGEER